MRLIYDEWVKITFFSFDYNPKKKNVYEYAFILVGVYSWV